jgi:hypothetical protein
MTNKKYVIYRCVLAGYDYIREDIGNFDWCDRILFTDDAILELKGYKKIIVDSKILGPSITNRSIKIKSHPVLREYKIQIYLDGNVAINQNIYRLAQSFAESKKSIAVFKHPRCENLQDEILEIIHSKKSSLLRVLAELKDITDDDIFSFAASDNSVIMRCFRDPLLEDAMDFWFALVKAYSGRDQLSLPRVIKKYNIAIHRFGIVPRNIFNGVFLVFPHSGEFQKKNFGKFCLALAIYWIWSLRWRKMNLRT